MVLTRKYWSINVKRYIVYTIHVVWTVIPLTLKVKLLLFQYFQKLFKNSIKRVVYFSSTIIKKLKTWKLWQWIYLIFYKFRTLFPFLHLRLTDITNKTITFYLAILSSIYFSFVCSVLMTLSVVNACIYMLKYLKIVFIWFCKMLSKCNNKTDPLFIFICFFG